MRSEHPRGRSSVRRLRELAASFLQSLGQRGELSILLTTDARIRRLNADWRDKPHATDVLAFSASPETGVLGDVVISLDTADRQARARRAPRSQELARLLAHGILHLLGHDHEEPAAAARMAREEVRLLGRVGLVGDALASRPADLEFHRARRRSQRTLRSRRRPATSRRRRASALEATS